MGLALLLVILKTAARRTGNAHYDEAARFWATGFSASISRSAWSPASPWSFNSASQLNPFLAEPQEVSSANHWRWRCSHSSSSLASWACSCSARSAWDLHLFSGVLLFLGSWLSGYFIVAADAWIPAPGGLSSGRRGQFPFGESGSAARQPIAGMAVLPHHAGRGHDRRHGDGFHRSLYLGEAFGLPAVCARRIAGRLCCFAAVAVPHRGPARRKYRAPSRRR